MNYLQHFGLKHDPLGKISAEHLDNEQYRLLKPRLDWLLQTKGLGLITGEAGVGKTTGLRQWTKQLNPLAYKVIYQSDNHFQPFDIYCQFAEMLGLERQHRYSQLWRMLKKELLSLYDDKKITPIWILDEAQHLRPQFLQELPAFLNLNFDTRDIVLIILSGNTRLHATIGRVAYASLASRIQFHFHFKPFESFEQFSQFLINAFEQAGCHQTILSQSGMQLIHMASKGRLRYAHRLLTCCLQIAVEQNKNHLPDDIIEQAINQLRSTTI